MQTEYTNIATRRCPVSDSLIKPWEKNIRKISSVTPRTIQNALAKNEP
jgi:hypothetical protein